jgi:transposase
MPAERVSMRKIRDVLRLTHTMGLSRRLVAEATGVCKSSVGDYIRRAEAARITWPIADGLGDAELELRLSRVAGETTVRAEPDRPRIHAELKRRAVTLVLLWQEYQAEHPGGYSYSRLCELFERWRARLSVTMRQTHAAGDKLFVDWAGDTIPVLDAATGEERRAHIFVAGLGASNYTYAEARWTETLSDGSEPMRTRWPISAACQRRWCPTTSRPASPSSSRYEPGINRTYQDLANDYGCVVLPTRIRSRIFRQFG